MSSEVPAMSLPAPSISTLLIFTPMYAVFFTAVNIIRKTRFFITYVSLILLHVNLPVTT